MGVLGAPTGSYAMQVDGQGNMWFQVYAPKVQSQFREASGWHVLKTTRPIPAGRPCTVTLKVDGKLIEFEVADAAGVQKRTFSAPLRLAEATLYAGDFPGDNSLSPPPVIHRGMTGSLQVSYCGPPGRFQVR